MCIYVQCMLTQSIQEDKLWQTYVSQKTTLGVSPHLLPRESLCCFVIAYTRLAGLQASKEFSGLYLPISQYEC